MRAAAASLLILAAGACAHRPGSGAEGPSLEAVQAGGAAFRVQYWPEDAAAARQVKGALAAAARRATRWGALSLPVLVTLHPSHAALEAAIHREGYGWLRAWARYATIDLQSPRTWSLAGGTDAEVMELLAHELTHCAMYQTAASEWSWPGRGIPLWFREGMASVAAGQEYKRARPEAIWRFYRDTAGSGDGLAAGGLAGELARPAGDPLTDPEPLYPGDSEVVYGTAHWAFRFLLDRYGEERVRRIVAGMGQGLPFGESFQAAIGIPAAGFEQDFRRYVVWQGWRQ
jgi:hypothetical protein